MTTDQQRGHWFRAYEDMGDDPKFRVVARRASSTVPGLRASDALAVWMQLLCRASSASPRGSVRGYDCETADASLDMPEGSALALYQAFEAKGMITPDGMIAKWEERQPKREDGSAERAKKWREQNARERNRTHANATERNQTLEQNRIEENKNKTPPYPPAHVEQPTDSPAPPRQAESGGGLSDSEIQENPNGIETQPWAVSLELQQLGEGYPQHRYDPGAAEIALKAASKQRSWPGMPRVMDDLYQRLATEEWQRDGQKLVPKLSNYIAKRMWLDPMPGAARASPEDEAAWARAQELSKKQAEKERKQGLRQ